MSVRGTGRTLLLTFAASATSAYSNSCVLQGHKPPTSATLSVGLTTRPHWPLSGEMKRYVKDMSGHKFADRGGDVLQICVLLANLGLFSHVPSRIPWYVCCMYLGTKGIFFLDLCFFYLPPCCFVCHFPLCVPTQILRFFSE